MSMSPGYRTAVRRFQRGAALAAAIAVLAFLALELLVPRVPGSWRQAALSLGVSALALAVWGAFALTILWLVWAWEGKKVWDGEE